jgi:hypothetical protein
LDGFFMGVYAALLGNPTQIQDAFYHGGIAGVSIVNGYEEGLSYVIGDPSPSEQESCVFNNGDDDYLRIAFGVPLLLSPGSSNEAPTEHEPRLFESDHPWERYPACARDGCCNMTEESGMYCGEECQPTNVLGGRRKAKRRESYIGK